ncbi:MAG: hypothetical protein OIF34_07585, partial [Porticoccaceae bacterium]|nr:hypothetical protein [Porticoccaceae bacterium]
MSATASRYSTEYFVPPHDPILGIYDRHIAPAITLENWHHKAIISGQKNNPTYIYIARGEITRLNR